VDNDLKIESIFFIYKMISDYIKEMLNEIKPGWKKIILSPKLKPLFIEVLEKIDESYDAMTIIPKPKHIFEAFKYFEPYDTKCVIIGQDPYPDPENAHGLSFSVPLGVKTPASLKNIYKALIKSKQMVKDPGHGNLEKWAKQGVLMLNLYLTRCIGDKTLHKFWDKFTTTLIEALIEIQPNIIFMLWGNIAQKTSTRSADGHECKVMKYTHPSPLAQSVEKFEDCDHFVNTNEILSEYNRTTINWDLNEPGPELKSGLSENQELIVLSVDGGCTGNGKKNACASYGVYFPATFNGIKNKIPNVKINGLVPNKELILNGLDIVETQTPIAPSNNRGELLGMIYGLRQILIDQLPIRGIKIYIILDSEYVMHMVNERIWKYARQNTIKTQKANVDLVVILYSLLIQMAEKYGLDDYTTLMQPSAHVHYATKSPMNLNWQRLTLLHQNSHIKEHEIDKSNRLLYEKWLCNSEADKLCTNAIISIKN
jgi:uracil-DNA glycosylase